MNWYLMNFERITKAFVDYAYETLERFFEEISATPKALNAALTHPPSRQVLGHLLRVGVENLLPMLMMQSIIHGIQRQVDDLYADREDKSGQHALNGVLFVLHGGVALLSFRLKTAMLVRQIAITLETPGAFSDNRLEQRFQICQEQKCSSLRFIQGTFRDLVAYYATEAMIYGVNFLPLIGVPSAKILSVYHNGRYILTMALPEVCNRHQMEYISQHQPLTLALGLGHALQTYGISYLIYRMTGVPIHAYHNSIESLTLISHTLLASQMHLPKANRELPIERFDLLGSYQKGIGFIFDMILLGLKKRLPMLLKEKSLSNMADLSLFIDYCQTSAFIRQAYKLIIPTLLHSEEHFESDPIIQANWKTLKHTTIATIDALLAMREHLALKVAAMSPHHAAFLTNVMFGTPKIAVEILLRLLNDEAFVKTLQNLRKQLTRMGTNELRQVAVSTPPLRSQQALLQAPSPLALPALPAAEVIHSFRRQSLSNSPPETPHENPTPMPDKPAPFNPSLSAKEVIGMGLFRRRRESSVPVNAAVVEHHFN